MCPSLHGLIDCDGGDALWLKPRATLNKVPFGDSAALEIVSEGDFVLGSPPFQWQGVPSTADGAGCPDQVV